MTHRCIASYDRIVGASIERAWENVRDWEHLPWLHRTSFRRVDLVEQGDFGWRAHLGFASGEKSLLELVIDGDRYVSRTLEGAGAGGEIWTTLADRGDGTTGVNVRFEQPGPAQEFDDRLGNAFVELYTRLWDEDEAMMVERAAALGRRSEPPPSRLDLGARSALALPLDVDAGGQRLRLVEIDGELVVHSRTCPHWLGPLDPTGDDGRAECPWHGYAFDVRAGRSCDGRALRLARPPRIEVAPDTEHVTLDWG